MQTDDMMSRFKHDERCVLFFCPPPLQSSVTSWESPTRTSSTGYWLRCWETRWVRTLSRRVTLWFLQTIKYLHDVHENPMSAGTETLEVPPLEQINICNIVYLIPDWSCLCKWSFLLSSVRVRADTQVKVWMNKFGWTENDEGQIFIFNQEESVKPKNIVEKIDFESEFCSIRGDESENAETLKHWNTEPWWAEFSHWALSVLYLKIILKVSRRHVNAACQSDLSADNSPHLHFNLQPFCVPLTMEQFDWWRQRRVQKSLRLWNNVCVCVC